MPRLPTPDDVSSARRPTAFNPDGTVATADTSMVGKGLQIFGQGIENLGNGFAKMKVAYDSKRDEASSIYVEKQLGEFLDGENQLYDEATKGLKPEEASGFDARWRTGYKERANQFADKTLKGLPDPVRHRYDTKLRSYEEQTGDNAKTYGTKLNQYHMSETLNAVLDNDVRRDIRALAGKDEADFATSLQEIKGRIDGLIDGLDTDELSKAKLRKERAKWAEETFALSLPPERRRELHPARTSEVDEDMGNVAAFIRARGVPATGMDKTFAGRLALALQWAENETGSTARINEGWRDSRTQAQYYANYTGRPVVWEGVTYTPKKRGGLAAPPGRSRHQRGMAADLQQGPVFNRLRQEWAKDPKGFRERFGLEFLNSKSDTVHIQLAGAGGRDSRSLHDFIATGGAPNVIRGGEGSVNADAFTELSFDELERIADGADREIAIAERDALTDTRDETRSKAFDLFRDDGMTQEWLDANRDDLGPVQYERYSKKLNAPEGASTDARETLRLFDLAESDPKTAEEQGREAWIDGDISKSDYFKLRRKADGDPTEKVNPDAKAARAWLSATLGKARDVRYGGYGIAHESEYAAANKVLTDFDEWSKAHPDAKPADASAQAEKLWAAEVARKVALGPRGELPMPRFAPAGVDAASMTADTIKVARERLDQATRSSMLTAQQAAKEEMLLQIWEGIIGGKPK